MQFREYSVTHESRQEPLDSFGCILIPACTKVIDEILKSLLTAIYVLLNSTPLLGLEEDDLTPCGFLPLTLHHLVEPPVDFFTDFARAGGPEAEVIVLGPDEVTFRHCLTLDECDHGKVH